jgi:DNA repair ATPase RecN
MIQIRRVAIWNRDGACRTVDFHLGKLNIITGEAKTGKSALLEIVEFCTGRKTVSLPEGALSRVVEWYGVIFATDDGSSIFVGRPAPEPRLRRPSGARRT